jgi:protein-arginine kinase activator protein McsA
MIDRKKSDIEFQHRGRFTRTIARDKSASKKISASEIRALKKICGKEERFATFFSNATAIVRDRLKKRKRKSKTLRNRLLTTRE